MKSAFLNVIALAAILAVSPPALAHVGHGDEFDATGDVQRVEVNPETDEVLGIQVAPIDSAIDGSAGVLIPATSLVEGDGKTYAFVEYEGFYEPVPVTTGATQGDLIEITEGLSVGEQLVTQGGLTLYAQSRRAQPDASETDAPATDLSTTAESVESIAISETTTGSGIPLLPIAGLGVVVALVGVGAALVTVKRGKHR